MNSDHACRDCAGKNGTLRRRVMETLWFYHYLDFHGIRERAADSTEGDDVIHTELTQLLSEGLIEVTPLGYRRTDHA